MWTDASQKLKVVLCVCLCPQYIAVSLYSVSQKQCPTAVPNLPCHAIWKTPPAEIPLCLQVFTNCHRGMSEGSELHTQRTWTWHPAVKSIQGCCGVPRVLETKCQCHECEIRRQAPYIVTVWLPSECKHTATLHALKFYDKHLSLSVEMPHNLLLNRSFKAFQQRASA